jgi:gas vesicle protein
MTLTGLALGRFAGLQGLLVGGIAGAAYGVLTCKKLSPIIKKKLFSANEKLNDQEIVATLKIIKENNPKVSKKQALDILANVKTEITKNPGTYRFV